MGEAPERVHLLEVEAIHQRSVTARFYHLIEKANFEVHTDYGPLGYANLGNGALFAQNRDTGRAASVEVSKPFDRPLTAENKATWSWSGVDAIGYKDGIVAILLVFVIPQGFTADLQEFNLRPNFVEKITGDRIRFLFLFGALHGRYQLVWRLRPLHSSVDDEVESAYTEITHNPPEEVLPCYFRPLARLAAAEQRISDRDAVIAATPVNAQGTQNDVAAAAVVQGPPVGRTLYDLIALIFQRIGLWIIPVAILIVALIISADHIATPQGEPVKLFGMTLWEKSGDGKLRIPDLPGGAGWIFLGYYNAEMQSFTTSTTYRVFKTNFPKATLPRIGEWIQLLVNRNVIIADFQKSGQKLRDTPPWSVHSVLQPEDYTGITLEKGSVVEVREVQPGHFTNHDEAVWVKVGQVPQ
jgi:hypothetical protein